MKESPLTTILDMIPYGRVTSYGSCAYMYTMLTGQKTSGWMLGRWLSALSPELQLQHPWWRVVAKTGSIVALKLGERGIIQQNHLISEGIVIDNHTVPQHFFWFFEQMVK